MRFRERVTWALTLAQTDPRGMAREAFLRVTEPLFPSARASRPEGDTGYQEWIETNEPDPAELNRQVRAQAAFGWRPLISIITPVLAPGEGVLTELIESVLAQTYDNFELCLGHFSEDVETRQVLERYANADPRIRVEAFGANEGISRNSARCAAFSGGEYLALLDHDDTLAPNALYENVARLNQVAFDLSYSDRDKISLDGKRHEPFFKPNWAPETLLSTNYLTHFTVFSREVFLASGGWDAATDGAQDWDLFLKISEHARRIVHIPRVLYHWRVAPGSTAMTMRAKPYSWAAQRRAVSAHLKRSRIPADVVSRRDGSIKLVWPPVSPSSLAVVALVARSEGSLGVARRLARRLPVDAPAIVIATEDVTLPRLLDQLEERGCPDLHVIVLTGGIRLRRSQSLSDLVGWLAVPGVSAVGGKVLSRFGGIKSLGSVLHLVDEWGSIYQGRRGRRGGPYGTTHWYADVYAPAAELFAFRLDRARQLFNDAPNTMRTFLDLFVVMNEAGDRCVYTPDVVVVDAAPARTRRHPLIEVGDQRIPAADRYFNPNLSLRSLVPRIRRANELGSSSHSGAGDGV